MAAPALPREAVSGSGPRGNVPSRALGSRGSESSLCPRQGLVPGPGSRPLSCLQVVCPPPLPEASPRHPRPARSGCRVSSLELRDAGLGPAPNEVPAPGPAPPRAPPPGPAPRLEAARAAAASESRARRGVVLSGRRRGELDAGTVRGGAAQRSGSPQQSSPGAEAAAATTGCRA